ncbi:MAG: tRNA (adenosine(37)-N6)-dimethylallyltransferase MiaA [Patescibacteria group bacterium]|nr:MAG: tRNA (adenosine(37)-N6)-dimethylallyltransferase MiaA [Patescibacteria group bacterium]
MKKLPKILVILGTTSSGKTKLAVSLARLYNGEIVGADSRQVYRGMDIGTGKDLAEYGSGTNRVKYHLIDIADPKRAYNLKRYQKDAYKAIDNILKRNKLPILVGGSGLYLQAIVDGYLLSENKPKTSLRRLYESMELSKLQTIVKGLDKAFYDRLNDSDKSNKRRLVRYAEILKTNLLTKKELQKSLSSQSSTKYDCLIIGLDCSLETIRQRIKKRLNQRFKEGMIEEVERLHEQGISWTRLQSFGLEYKYISLYLQGKIKKKEMKEKLNIAIGQFAKRQKSWFKRWEKQGREICWVKNKKSLKDILSFIS